MFCLAESKLGGDPGQDARTLLGGREGRGKESGGGEEEWGGNEGECAPAASVMKIKRAS
jgi:hypothetical protein